MRLYASAYLIAACTILTACAGELYKGYEGPDRSKGEIAVLDWSASCCIIVRVRAIDGIYDPKFNAGLCCGGIYHAELLPGKHKIHWEAKIPGTRTIYEAGVINMKAGHVYSVRASRGVWFIPNKGATWIEDLTTGEVVLGSKALK